MKKLFFASLVLAGFVFLASPAGSAVAYQIATVTATGTFIPPSVTPTSWGNSCPVGTPAGWGTYTPSALWLVECGNCQSVITPTSTGTAVPTLDGTLYPTEFSATGTAEYLTGTPTVISTPTPTSISNSSYFFSCSSIGISGATCTQINDYSFRIDFNGGGSAFGSKIIFSSSSNVATVYYDANYLLSYEIGYGLPDANDNFIFSGFVSENNSPILQFMNGYDSSWVGWGWSGLKSVVRTGEFILSQYTETSFMSGGTDNRVYMSYPSGGTLFLSALPFSNLTPTPEVTSTPQILDTGYCSSVSPVIADFGFSLFLPDGAPNCDMGWDEFGVGEYIIPAVQICFQPSQFGVIRLFGNDYEVGIYGLAAAAAFLWRYFRTV